MGGFRQSAGMDRFDAGPQPAGRMPAPGRLAYVQAFLNSFWDLEGGGGGERWSSPARLRRLAGARGFGGAAGAGDPSARVDSARDLAGVVPRQPRRSPMRPARSPSGPGRGARSAPAAGWPEPADGALEPAGDGPYDACGLGPGIVLEARGDGTSARLKACPTRTAAGPSTTAAATARGTGARCASAATARRARRSAGATAPGGPDRKASNRCTWPVYRHTTFTTICRTTCHPEPRRHGRSPPEPARQRRHTRSRRTPAPPSAPPGRAQRRRHDDAACRHVRPAAHGPRGSCAWRRPRRWSAGVASTRSTRRWSVASSCARPAPRWASFARAAWRAGAAVRRAVGRHARVRARRRWPDRARPARHSPPTAPATCCRPARCSCTAAVARRRRRRGLLAGAGPVRLRHHRRALPARRARRSPRPAARGGLRRARRREAGLTMASWPSAGRPGASEAINLDGGGSTSLVAAGELRNCPRE